MTLRWQKRGRIFVPNGDGYLRSHAARPVPMKLNEKVIRVFFSSRDGDDRMLPTYIDVDIDDPSKVLRVNHDPLIHLGRPGTFDDSGVTLASMVEHNGGVYFYYTGWKRRRINVSFELSIGLLRMNADGTLDRVFEGPLLAQDRHHPFLVAGPFVLRVDGAFRMWYCSGTEWITASRAPEPLYRVCCADSTDGVSWTPRIDPVIDYKYAGEVISAPWVVETTTGYSMWYSTRGTVTRDAKNYLIGYAESADGLSWTRRDEIAGIELSEQGWDSEMICYPALFQHQDRMYMFYSGNGVGRGGLGYAVV